MLESFPRYPRTARVPLGQSGQLQVSAPPSALAGVAVLMLRHPALLAAQNINSASETQSLYCTAPKWKLFKKKRKKEKEELGSLIREFYLC